MGHVTHKNGVGKNVGNFDFVNDHVDKIFFLGVTILEEDDHVTYGHVAFGYGLEDAFFEAVSEDPGGVG